MFFLLFILLNCIEENDLFWKNGDCCNFLSYIGIDEGVKVWFDRWMVCVLILIFVSYRFWLWKLVKLFIILLYFVVLNDNFLLLRYVNRCFWFLILVFIFLSCCWSDWVFCFFLSVVFKVLILLFNWLIVFVFLFNFFCFVFNVILSVIIIINMILIVLLLS